MKFSNSNRCSRWASLITTGLAAALPLIATTPAGAAAGTSSNTPGAVYILTNNVANNEVDVFNRSADGTLAPGGSFSTGGLGSGGPTGSTGALVLGAQSPANLSGSNRYLFAVNPGSDSISVLAVQNDGLVLLDQQPSGGRMPISLTVRKNLLYVLNSGSSNISGFTVGAQGELTPLPGSTRPISGGAAAVPAQIQFDPKGELLVVTERNTGIIDTYLIDKDGLPGGPILNRSNGDEPFGFAFTQRGQLIVTEAHRGIALQGAASSYNVAANGTLQVISPSVRNTQSDTCWIVITDNDRYAYVANLDAGTVSSYRVAPDGTLSLLEPIAASTGPGSAPVDEALSNNSRYYYAHSAANGLISSYQVQPDGTLVPTSGVVAGLPPSAIGLAAK